MSIRKKAFLALLLISILWGTAGVVAKILIQELHPFVVLFYRFGIAAIVILPWFIRAKKPKNMWRVLIPFSLLGAGNALFFYQGITRTTVSSAAVIGASTPLVTAILSHYLINERTSKDKFIGVIIGLIGALCIILLPLWNQGKSIGGDVLGNIWIVLSVLSWTLYVVGSRRFLTNDTYTPLVMAQVNFLTLAATSFILAIVTKQVFYTKAFVDPAYVFTFVYSTIPVTVITFVLFQWVIKHISATTASLKDYVQLIVGVSVSLIALGETINTSFILGSMIVLIGISITTGRSVYSKIMEKVIPIK